MLPSKNGNKLKIQLLHFKVSDICLIIIWLKNRKVALHFEETHYTEISFKFSYLVYVLLSCKGEQRSTPWQSFAGDLNVSILQNAKS